MRILVALLLALSTPALAQASRAVVSVDLLDGWRQPDGTRVAALEIRLAPGWHTYWRVPGAAGIPPSFDWSGSENLQSVAYEWPRPEIFERFGMESFGFADVLVLPVRLAPQDPDRPMHLALALAFGVCDDICVPADARLAATITPDGPEEGRSQIEAALAERPVPGERAGIASVSCSLVPRGTGYEIEAEITFAGEPMPYAAAVLEPGQSDLWIGESGSETVGRSIVARAPIEAAGPGGPVLERRSLRVTLLAADRAIEVRGCQAPVQARLR